MSERESSGPTECIGIGWFVVVLAGTVGIAIGIALGFALSASAGSSIGELSTQRDRLAAENTALTAERDRLRVANATLAAEKTRTDHPLEQANLHAQHEPGSKSSEPRATEWTAGREIENAYGPSSTFGGFAQRLEATNWWNAGTYWSLRGNVEVLPEATDLQLKDPVSAMFAGRLSVSFRAKSNAATPRFEIDLEKTFLMGEKYSSTLQGACEAVGRAMEF